MKMTLRLLRTYSIPSPIERFAFDTPYSAKDSFMAMFAEVTTTGFDPLIEEQDVPFDLESRTFPTPGNNYAKPNYLVAIPVTADNPPQDRDPRIWCYYVTKIVRKPGRGVSLVHIKLDAVTTLLFECSRNSITLESLLTDQSYIKREHKTRFLIPASYDPDNPPTYLQYDIDKVSEGIPVEYKKIRSINLYGSSVLPNVRWYLVYKSAEVWSTDTASSNPITAYLVPSDKLKISDATSSGSGSPVVWNDPSDVSFVIYNYHVITKENSPGFSMKISGTGRINGAGTVTTFGDRVFSSADYCMVQIYYEYSGTTMYAYIRAYKGEVNAITGMDEYDCTTNVLGGKITKFEFTTATFFYVLQTGSTSPEDIEEGAHLQINAGTTSVPAVYTTQFSDLNRTDPLIVKIIELPYCPDAITKSGTNYSVGHWNFDQSSKMFVPTDSSTYSITLYNNDDGVPYVAPETYRALLSPSLLTVWNGDDAKLFHSDFHPIKIVYDVYAVNVKLENTNLLSSVYTSDTARRISVNWSVSPDINSVFALKATLPYNIGFASWDQDFGEWCVIDRNNEKPIFTNAYLNYMRVGYNYDQKAKSIQNWASILGTAASAIGTIAGAAMGNVAFTAMSAAGLVSSISSLAAGVAGRENSMQSKLSQLKAQATSVAGSNDVAILNKYCPWVKYIEYEPVENTKNMLARLFHLYGYKCETFKVPDLSSRSLWNYVEGEVVFKRDIYYNTLPENLFTRAIEQFKNGITILHFQDNNISGKFDFAQKYENWENALL